MKLSYKYRGAAYLFLLVVLLPWAAWHYALGDTVRAAFECRRLTARLAVAETPKAVGAVDPASCIDGRELILSGVLLDTLQSEIATRNLRVTGYVPVVTERQEGLELHTAQLSLTGRFTDLVRFIRHTRQTLPQCRMCAAVWLCTIDRTTRQPQLTLTLYLQQLTQIR